MDYYCKGELFSTHYRKISFPQRCPDVQMYPELPIQPFIDPGTAVPGDCSPFKATVMPELPLRWRGLSVSDVLTPLLTPSTRWRNPPMIKRQRMIF